MRKKMISLSLIASCFAFSVFAQEENVAIATDETAQVDVSEASPEYNYHDGCPCGKGGKPK